MNQDFRNLDLIVKILFLIRYIPPIAVLFYAYLYIIGYIYLSAYFSKWGLDTLQIGFSIVDYATVAMYPIFAILAFAIVSFLFGYRTFSTFSGSKKPKSGGSNGFPKKLESFLVYFMYPIFFMVVILINAMKRSKSIQSWM